MKLMTLVFFVAVVAIQTAWSSPFCTASDVEGTYAFQAEGSVLVPGTPITGPFMRQGLFNADGIGNISIKTLAVYNGINFGFENFGGTYTVTTDCTIELKVAIPAPIFANATFKGTVANDGEDVMFMLMSTENPQAPAITTVLGHGRRLKLNSCRTMDLNGAYRFEVNGWLKLPPVGTATPERLLGSIQTNGAGALTASFIESNGGIIGEQSTTGSYTVNSDCTFAISFALDGFPMIMRGSLIGFGGEAFVVLNPPGQTVAVPPFGPVEINGVVATGSMLKESIWNAHRY